VSKGGRTIVRFAALGLGLAAAFFGYSETNRAIDGAIPVWSRAAVVVFCPGCLFFSTVDIDIKPHTWAFNEMWLIIAIANAAIYAVIGATLVLLRRLRKDSTSL
jgi:hypothetical protein